MKAKILFIDDDANVLAGFQRTLRNQFTFDTALGGAEGLEKIRSQGPYALLVVDMFMPEMDGLEFFEQAQKIAPDAVRIMLTGNVDQQTAVGAVNRGNVFRFLNKPCLPEMLILAIQAGLERHAAQETERELLEGTLIGSVKMLSEVLGMVAPAALGRGQRLRELISRFARFLKITPVWELEVAALLSAVGCASLPAPVLSKLSSGEDRTIEEEKIIRRIPQIGHDLLVAIPRLAEVARIVLFQQKAFDGSDIPSIKCAGENLPVGSRMLRILNDRMTLEATGIVKRRALEAMTERAGVYDPGLLAHCFACFPETLASAVAGNGPTRRLQANELLPDQIVVADITTNQGLVLVGAGDRLTPMVLQRLKNYDVMAQLKLPVLVQDPSKTPAAPAGAVVPKKD